MGLKKISPPPPGGGLIEDLREYRYLFNKDNLLRTKDTKSLKFPLL